jgi:hypothetical protein
MSPNSLHDLLEEPAYSRLKKLFVDRRASFKANPGTRGDLEAYERADDSHDYTVL